MQLYSVRLASEDTGVPQGTIRKLIRRGEFKPKRIGWNLFLTAKQVERLRRNFGLKGKADSANA
jgi:hypothetical protein